MSLWQHLCSTQQANRQEYIAFNIVRSEDKWDGGHLWNMGSYMQVVLTARVWLMGRGHAA